MKAFPDMTDAEFASILVGLELLAFEVDSESYEQGTVETTWDNHFEGLTCPSVKELDGLIERIKHYDPNEENNE